MAISAPPLTSTFWNLPLAMNNSSVCHWCWAELCQSSSSAGSGHDFDSVTLPHMRHWIAARKLSSFVNLTGVWQPLSSSHRGTTAVCLQPQEYNAALFYIRQIIFLIIRSGMFYIFTSLWGKLPTVSNQQNFQDPLSCALQKYMNWYLQSTSGS